MISAARLVAPVPARRLLSPGRAWVPGGPALRCEAPARPASIRAGAWRRASALTRMVLAACEPLLAGRDDLASLAVVFGSVLGELEPTTRFLERLFEEGTGSPLAFQNSVYNAPVGHLSTALGLRGPSETVAAGGATSLVALARGLDLVRAGRAPAALVVVGDAVSPLWERSAALLALPVPVGEAVAAVLLEPGGALPVEVAPHLPLGPTWARSVALPREVGFEPTPGALPLEDPLGLVPSPGLAAVAAMAVNGSPGAVVERDGPWEIRARVG